MRGEKVNYTVPQKLRLSNIDGAVGIFFRVNKVMEAGTVRVTDAAGAQIAAFRREHMAPGEMEQIRLPRKLLEGAAGPITISVEEGSNA